MAVTIPQLRRQSTNLKSILTLPQAASGFGKRWWENNDLLCCPVQAKCSRTQGTRAIVLQGEERKKKAAGLTGHSVRHRTESSLSSVHPQNEMVSRFRVQTKSSQIPVQEF